MQYLTKLKILSNYKKITLLLLVASLSIRTPYLFKEKISSLKSTETKIYGYIEEYEKNEQYLSFKIRLKSHKKEYVKGILYKDINLKYNDYVKINGTLKEITGYCNFNCFSYSEWASNQNMHYSIDVENIKIIKKNQNIFYTLKNKITERIEKNKSSPYLFALILGNSDKIEDDVQKSYQENGISHLFALSGMHLYFLIRVLTFISKKMNVNKTFANLIIILVLTFFIFLTSFPISLLRSYFFYILKTIKNKIKREENNIFPLIQSFSILILIDPFYLLDVGFIYSFTISFAILIVSSKLNKIESKILSSLYLSFVIFIVSIPISTYYFHQVNMLGIFYNLFFIPFISCFLFPFSFIVFLFPILSPIYEKLVIVLEASSLFLQKITIGTFIMRHPSILMLCIMVLIVIISLYLSIKNIKYSTILILIFIVLYKNANFFIKESYLTMLDVGQGDSLVIHTKNKSILIDTGGSIYNNLSDQTIIPYLKSKGIKTIDLLILTHGDYDHMGEAINLVESFKVEKVMFNCGEFNELEKDLIKVLEKKKIPYYSCIKELNIGDSKLFFLNNKDYGNENDNSSVIYTELNNYKFLFMGDAGVDVEEDLIQKYTLQNIEVLKVGHHGSKTSSGKEFINKINPKYSIISIGKNNRYGHPNKEVLEALDDSKIYRTDLDGSIMFKIKNNKLQIETCEP